MATMPSSGQISSSDLTSTFGSSSPPKSSDYYRGAFIPSTETTIGSWTSYMYSPNTYEWIIDITPTTGRASIIWNGVTVTSSLSPGLTEWVAGGYRYQIGTLQSAASPFRFYELRRRQESTDTINHNVPTSGQITSSQWYGARTAN